MVANTNRNSTETTREWIPSPKQSAVLEVAHTGEFRTFTAICNEAKVTRKTLRQWLRDDKDFIKAWADTWILMIDRNMPTMTAAQIKKASQGNTNAFRELTTLSGKMIRKLDISSGGEPLHIVGIEVVKPDGDA